MCNKTKCRTKKHFCRYCFQCFSSEKMLIEHKETCLINVKINCKNKWKTECKIKKWFN